MKRRVKKSVQSWLLQARDLDLLIQVLLRRGYSVVGPRVVEGAFVLDRLTCAADLPGGWTSVQDCASFRVQRRNDGALFGYNCGAQSWKKYLHPAERTLYGVERRNGALVTHCETPPPPPLALFGVRACELRAIQILDRVFLNGAYVDPHYRELRESALIVAVNCVEAGGTCFCASMNSGPRATEGFDLCLTEIIGPDEHYFLTESGSVTGGDVLGELELEAAERRHVDAAKQAVERAAAQMGRRVDGAGLHELLYRNAENPYWKSIAGRCLTCANCTMSCPTCFCTTIEDRTDLSGAYAERIQRWDSCFTLDFSYIHGGSVRTSAQSRYRQWLTHKLAAWQDQFGVIGCVGCGRCITWCPAGIDITAEVAALRERDAVNIGESG